MNMLKVKDLKKALVKAKVESGLTDAEFNNLYVMIGDDEELNGIHESYYCQVVDINDTDDMGWEDCNDYAESVGVKDHYILIS